MKRFRRVFHAIFLLFHILFILFIFINYFSEEDVAAVQSNNEMVLDLNENNIIKYKNEDNSVKISIAVTDDNIEKVIEKEMKDYYKIVYDQFNQEGAEEVYISVVRKQGVPVLGFHYSRERFEQIDRDMTQTFFLKHIERKTTDILNNANNYYIDKEIWKKTSVQTKEDLNGKREKR